MCLRIYLILLIFGFVNMSPPLLMGQLELVEPETKNQMTEFQRQNDDTLKQMAYVQEFIALGQNPKLKFELEIVDEQAEQLVKVSQRLQDQLQAMMGSKTNEIMEIQELARAKKFDEVAKRNLELDKEQMKLFELAIKEIKTILLPHQIERLKQLSVQRRLKFGTEYLGNLGLPLALANQLDLSKEETKKLKEATEKANTEFEQVIGELHEKFLRRVMDSLPREKRKAVTDLIGDFDKDSGPSLLGAHSPIR